MSALRVHEWLTSVNRVAPDGRHFLLRRCNIGDAFGETASETIVPTEILFDREGGKM